MDTPWGQANFVENTAEGITFYSTPSHGGFRLSPERNAQVDPKYRAFAAKWSKGYFDGSADTVGWYEEDCAALAVVVTFPALFPNLTEDDHQKFVEQLDEWMEK